MVSRIRRAVQLATLAVGAVLGVLLGIGLQSEAQAQSWCKPYVDHFEWTQAIQREDNSVPMFGGRLTTVRAFLRLPTGCASAGGIDARFTLKGLTFGENLYSVLSDNGPITVDSDNVWDRADANASLNFTFTPRLSIDEQSLSVQACPHPSSGSCTEFGLKQFVTFKRVGNPRILAVQIEVEAELPDAEFVRPGGGGEMGLRAVHGFHEGGLYRLHPTTYTVDKVGGVSGGPMLPDSQLFGSLRAVASGAVADWVYGWIPDSQFGRCYSLNSAGLCARGSGELYGFQLPTSNLAAGISYNENLNRQLTTPHEFTHFLRRIGETAGDIDEVGWDTLIPSGRLGHGRPKKESFADILASGGKDDKKWIGPEMYETSMNHIAAKYASIDPIKPRRIIYVPVSAPLYPTETWSIDTVHHIERPMRNLVPELGFPVELRAENASGEAVYTTTVNLLSTCYECDPSPQFMLPESAAAVTLSLFVSGTLEASLSRSAYSPTLSISSPGIDDVITSGTTISWINADLDGDDLLSHVHYSADGLEWYPLTYMSTETSISFGDTAKVPFSTDGKIRVIVTDGFNTIESIVDGLDVGSNHDPLAWIASPVSGTVFKSGSVVQLVGGATDMEDRDLSGSSLSWSSNVAGVLGTGISLNIVGLSSGSHTISLTATDSLSATDIVTRMITIGP